MKDTKETVSREAAKDAKKYDQEVGYGLSTC